MLELTHNTLEQSTKLGPKLSWTKRRKSNKRNLGLKGLKPKLYTPWSSQNHLTIHKKMQDEHEIHIIWWFLLRKYGLFHEKVKKAHENEHEHKNMRKTLENHSQGQGLIANTQDSQCSCHSVGNESSKPLRRQEEEKRSTWWKIRKLQGEGNRLTS